MSIVLNIAADFVLFAIDPTAAGKGLGTTRLLGRAQ